MVLDKLAREVLFFAEGRKQPSEQTHMVAGLLLQGGRCYKATKHQKHITGITFRVAGYWNHSLNVVANSLPLSHTLSFCRVFEIHQVKTRESCSSQTQALEPSSIAVPESVRALALNPCVELDVLLLRLCSWDRALVCTSSGCPSTWERLASASSVLGMCANA